MDANATTDRPELEPVSAETRDAIEAAFAAAESPEDPLENAPPEIYEGLEAIGVLPIAARHLWVLRYELENKQVQLRGQHLQHLMKLLVSRGKPTSDFDEARRQLHDDLIAVNRRLNQVIGEELGLKLDQRNQYLLLPGWEIAPYPMGQALKELLKRAARHSPAFRDASDFMDEEETSSKGAEKPSELEEALQEFLSRIFDPEAGDLKIKITIKVKRRD